jgi:hypothetical protein
MLELSDKIRISAARQKVWDALNDPRMLKACIPGCESLVSSGDNGFEAVVLIKVGPVKARFKGQVTLSNINAPESYTLRGEGKGGAAGMAKGDIDVLLEEDGDATILNYTVKADISGKLAAIGSRLIQSTMKKYAGDFFELFGSYITGAVPLPSDEPAAATEPGVARQPLSSGTAVPAVMHRGGEDAAHIRRINWALLAINVALLTYILSGL